MPPWSISNQCLSRTEQLAGLVRDEFFHGLNAGEDAQHERLRRHGKAQVAERQEEDCRTAGLQERRRKKKTDGDKGHGKWDLKRSVGALNQICRLCDMVPALKAALPFAIAPQASPPPSLWAFWARPLGRWTLARNRLSSSPLPLPMSAQTLPHSRVTRFNAYLLRLDHATHIPPSSFTKHFHGLKSKTRRFRPRHSDRANYPRRPLLLDSNFEYTQYSLARSLTQSLALRTVTPFAHFDVLRLSLAAHGGRSNADILPRPENRHRLTSSACLTTVLTTPYFTPIPRVCQFPLRSTSRLGFCSLSSRRHESSPSLDPPSNARSLDHASLTIARSELLRRTFSPFFLPWDPHSVLPLVQQPNLLPLLLRLRPVSSIDLSLLVIIKRNTVDYFAGE
ncbi:hypothetical protein CPAR01_12478 [Colletotrichum paranaense]|uniref:Uncharacterized protein n=1 Tax=Colletotrichum paranaense TaxID=1914294 RepID=A0ABQ9S7K5_9PEZI|nr:uncharacterized protein CPAR01_12478 [Colletotrichum paranaense]KAK1527920.1 hypothetical protein CPAR01_12478 [Colletotrichum paranaense]